LMVIYIYFWWWFWWWTNYDIIFDVCNWATWYNLICYGEPIIMISLIIHERELKQLTNLIWEVTPMEKRAGNIENAWTIWRFVAGKTICHGKSSEMNEQSYIVT
jgi:hypothetical protein